MNGQAGARGGTASRRSRATALAIAAVTVGAGCASGAPPSGERHGCVTMRVVTAGGEPAGAVALSVGATAGAGDGTEAITTAAVSGPSADGTARADLTWTSSRPPSLTVTVGHAEAAYAFGPFPAVAAGAAGGASACQDLGLLSLAPAAQLAVGVCSLSGVVQDGSGRPLGGGGVAASDPSVAFEARAALCSLEPELCQPGTTVEADGTFTIRALVSSGPTIEAHHDDDSDPVFRRTRFGRIAFAGCPAEPAVITADQGFDTIRDVTVALAGTRISWSGGFAASTITVWRGDLRTWLVEAPSGMQSPVTYGAPPPGAVQRAPPAGLAPPPLAPGDRIVVLLEGIAPDGFPYHGTGAATVP